MLDDTLTMKQIAPTVLGCTVPAAHNMKNRGYFCKAGYKVGSTIRAREVWFEQTVNKWRLTYINLCDKFPDIDRREHMMEAAKTAEAFSREFKRTMIDDRDGVHDQEASA